MQIEQFDTGLKTKKNIKDIVLSPEQNFRNKNLIPPGLESSKANGMIITCSMVNTIP